jgi:RND superfamily putative drug exporter
VRALVALADVGGASRGQATVTIGELLTERIEMTQPWYRFLSTGRSARRWLERVNSVLGEGRATVRPESTLVELPQLERAVALASVALAERTPIVMLDQLDPFVSDDDETAFVAAVARLAPSTTTLVIGTPIPSRGEPVADRALVSVDLYSLSSEGLVR